MDFQRPRIRKVFKQKVFNLLFIFSSLIMLGWEKSSRIGSCAVFFMSDLSCRTYFCEVRCLATRLSLLQGEYTARILRNTLYQIIHTFLVFYKFLLSWRVSNSLNSSNNTLGLSKQTDLSNKLFTSRQSQFCLNYLYTDFVVLQCKQVSSLTLSN